MLDTVKLCLNDWEIRDTSRLIVQPSPVNYGTGELVSIFHYGEMRRETIREGARLFSILRQ